VNSGQKSQFATKADVELRELAAALPEAEQKEEEQLRPELIKAWQGFRVSRWALGKALMGYQALYKKAKQNKGEIKRFDLVLRALGCERSQGYRYLSGYRQASKVSESIRLLAEARSIDLAEAKHARLASQIQERQSEGHPDRELSDVELLDKSIKAVKLAKETAAPTIAKENGPVPVPPVKQPVNPSVRKAELIAEYRTRYSNQVEADRVIDALIVAALEAQLSKLPPVVMTAQEAA
jgi:hypothetical protein